MRPGENRLQSRRLGRATAYFSLGRAANLIRILPISFLCRLPSRHIIRNLVNICRSRSSYAPIYQGFPFCRLTPGLPGMHLSENAGTTTSCMTLTNGETFAFRDDPSSLPPFFSSSCLSTSYCSLCAEVPNDAHCKQCPVSLHGIRFRP